MNFYGATAGTAKINLGCTQLNMSSPNTSHPSYTGLILLHVAGLPLPGISSNTFPFKQCCFLMSRCVKINLLLHKDDVA